MAVSIHMPIPPVRSSYAGTGRVMCWAVGKTDPPHCLALPLVPLSPRKAYRCPLCAEKSAVPIDKPGQMGENKRTGSARIAETIH